MDTARSIYGSLMSVKPHSAHRVRVAAPASTFCRVVPCNFVLIYLVNGQTVIEGEQERLVYTPWTEWRLGSGDEHILNYEWAAQRFYSKKFKPAAKTLISLPC